MQDWLWWMLTLGVLQVLSDDTIMASEKPERMIEVYDMINKIARTLPGSGYQLEKLLEMLKS